MSKNKTLIKICGLTSEEQALQIAKFGADAIGIISVKESPRFVVPEIKEKIFKTLEVLYPKIERVSVVKNYPIDSIIKDFFGKPSENVIQLHGDEDINYCKKIKQEMPHMKLWKAFRIRNIKDLEDIKSYENLVDAILLDSWSKETYGGSGKKIKTHYLRNLKFSKPWWLAGGVSLDWIEEIINDIRPYGLDISSSIEISPGLKNLKETERLINYLKKCQ